MDRVDIMMDLETLSVDSNAVITAIGLVVCNLKTGEAFKRLYND